MATIRLRDPLRCLLALSTVLLVSCNSNTRHAAPGHVETVSAIPLTKSLRRRELRSDATLAIGKSVTIKSPIAAPLSENFIAAPQTVEAEQEIALFDLKETELALEAKRSTLATAQARLDQDLSKTGAEDVAADEGEPLPQHPPEEAEATGEPKDEATLLSLTVEQLRHETSLLEHQLNQAQLVTPLSPFYAGQPIAVGEAIYRLESTDPLTLRLLVSLEHAAYLDEGMPLTFIPYSNPETRIAGVLDTLSPYAENADLFEVTGHVENPNGTLKDKQKGEVRITTTRQDSVYTLPRSAIITPEARPELKSNSPMVFVIRGDTLSLQPVKLGQGYGEDVEVTGGLEEGELVANTNLAFLFEGEHVKIKAEAPPPAAVIK